VIPVTILTWQQLFGSPTGRRNNLRKLEKAEWRTLPTHTMFDGYTYAAGSEYKFWETENFGYVLFRTNSLTPEGARPGRFIHRY
jgi:hypothetical protein